LNDVLARVATKIFGYDDVSYYLEDEVDGDQIDSVIIVKSKKLVFDLFGYYNDIMMEDDSDLLPDDIYDFIVDQENTDVDSEYDTDTDYNSEYDTETNYDTETDIQIFDFSGSR
jgi:hypothetical protein